jgi:hypothetical protein
MKRMEIARTAKPVREMADVKLWHCCGCGVVHMSVGKMLLNFNHEEFSDFADAVIDISTTGWLHGGREYSIIDLIATEDEAGIHNGNLIH